MDKAWDDKNVPIRTGLLHCSAGPYCSPDWVSFTASGIDTGPHSDHALGAEVPVEAWAAVLVLSTTMPLTPRIDSQSPPQP
jgi:hypothetical protein